MYLFSLLSKGFKATMIYPPWFPETNPYICTMEDTVERQLASQKTYIVSKDGVSELTLGREGAQSKGVWAIVSEFSLVTSR